MPYLQDSTATDNERDAERAVQGPLTGNAKVTGDHQQDEDEDEEGQERQQRCSRPLHPSRQPSSRIHTMSTPARPKQHRPLEHLADLGPLGAVRDEKIDVLGAEAVVLPGQEPSLSTELSVATNLVHSNKSAPSTLEQQQQPLDRLSHCPSSSTLVSESSHTSQSTAESFSKKTADHGTEAEGLVWSGVHPLLMDYSSEPGLMDEVDNDCYDDERDNGQDKPPAHLQRRSESTRNANKDVGQPQGHGSHWNTSAGGIDTVAGGFAGTRRRRRNVSKADDSRSWTSNEERDVGGHSSNDTTESDGKRVIIHQVAVTDTLAGIALYYGIQVPILKKSNKLWTNDSIHTRKYLYIPFEECTVARKAGVMVDENNQTVILPQRVQQQQQQQQHSSSHNTSESIVASHGNAGPTSLPSSFANSRTSNFDISEGQLGNGTSPKELAVPPAPPISAVAAGMLPSNNNTPFNSSGTGTVTHASSTGSPRVGTWVDPKSMAAPPVPSSTMTSTTLTFDNSLKAAAHSLPQPRRRATENDVSGPRSAIPPLLSMGTSVSEDLPNTMVVPPSMTHEALAARFKEMDLVLSEQQQHRGKMLGQDRELRTNPVHQRHRTLDLRQMAMGRSRMDQDDREAEEEQERRHMYGEGASDQMTTAALAHGGMNAASVNGGDSMDGTTLTTTTLRRQELITVPAGVLSYFPSPEHSKRLETPQSISRIQGRIMTENLQGVSPSSLSGSSTSSGSFREALQSRKGGAGVENLSVVTKSKGRATLGENTFRAPTVPTGSSSSSRTLTRHARRTPSSSSSYSGYSPTSPKMSSPYTKSVRISNPQQQQQQKWSTMGESLVDELLGAVRGPLRIARRMYNFTTLGFGTVMGSGGNSTSGGYKDASDYSGSGSVSSLSSLSGVRRKTSYGRRSSYGRRTGRNSHHHKEHRHSAIELDQAGINSTLSSALNLSAGRKRASIVAATVAAEEPEIASGVGQVQVHAQDAERVVQDGKAGTAATTPNSISS
ncbi:hypothetical protein EDD11_002261 [Mortierella claussenii]|nr:hypothetical protein EDD11_002261 [Mortierella claussenii]